MRRHFVNAIYGVLDYGSYPFGMLLVAPVVLHRLGAAEYGVWMISTAVVSAGGILASGFCDANIQRVASLRGTGATTSMIDAVRSMLGINLVLGMALAIAVWIAAPFAAMHITVASTTPLRECVACLRIASVLILVRAVESVSVSTQRAFEQYRDEVQVSIAVRLVTLAAAALLVQAGDRVTAILGSTAIFLVWGTCQQFRQMWRLLGKPSLWPSFHPRETRVLVGSGIFAWAQTAGSIVFGQLDRVMLGIYLGAVALAPYALCIQFAQPIFGLTASGLNFLFPYVTARASMASSGELVRTILKAFACNLLLVSGTAGMLMLCGPRLIRLWAGTAVAHSATALLPPIVVGSALLGLGVTGTYAMQALGLFRTVAAISIGGRAATLLVMIYLLRHRGIEGLASARVLYGAVALIVYLPLVYELGRTKKAMRPSPGLAGELHEGTIL